MASRKRRRKPNVIKRGAERDGEVMTTEEAGRKMCGKYEDGKGIAESEVGEQVTFDVGRN